MKSPLSLANMAAVGVAVLLLLPNMACALSSPGQRDAIDSPTSDVNATIAAALARVDGGKPESSPATTKLPELQASRPAPIVRALSVATPTPLSTPTEKVSTHGNGAGKSNTGRDSNGASRLPSVPCSDPCSWDYERDTNSIDWLLGPQISREGYLDLIVRIDESKRLIVLGGNGGSSNVNLTDGGRTLYGSILPPPKLGWDWNPGPGWWVADRYRWDGTELIVGVQLDPAASSHPNLHLCLWTGGPAASSEVLDCVPIQQP